MGIIMGPAMGIGIRVAVDVAVGSGLSAKSKPDSEKRSNHHTEYLSCDGLTRGGASQHLDGPRLRRRNSSYGPECQTIESRILPFL